MTVQELNTALSGGSSGTLELIMIVTVVGLIFWHSWIVAQWIRARKRCKCGAFTNDEQEKK